MASTTIFRLRFNRNYTTFVKTGHGHVKVDFMPIVLFGRTENSQFGTADPEVIEGLKKHAFFGSLFYVEEEGKEAPARIPAENPNPEEENPMSGMENSRPDTDDDTLTHEKTVTSKNKAIAYLLEKHGTEFSQTSDIAKMKEEAQTVYNLMFDNWK